MRLTGARLAIVSPRFYILSNDAGISVRDNLSLGVTQLTLIAHLPEIVLVLSARKNFTRCFNPRSGLWRYINYFAITQ